MIIPFLPGGNITTPTVLEGKPFTLRDINSHYPKGILFIPQTDLVKYLQMPVNDSNPKTPSPLYPKRRGPAQDAPFLYYRCLSENFITTLLATHFMVESKNHFT